MNLKLTKFIIIALLLISIPILASQLNLIGAGVSFPYSIYSKWADAYQAKTGIKINYEVIGSGGGIKQIQTNAIAFGASDLPLTAPELNKLNLMQFPTVVSGIVPVINVPGIQSGALKLSGQVLADIFSGKISNWNDSAIQLLNPTLHLPDQLITVVHRSDSSGTTYLFTDYLAKSNVLWQKKVNTSISWPVGMGGKGNDGVGAYVKRIKGSIGYVDFSYAEQQQLNLVQMKNQAGHFILPSLDTFKAALLNANWKNATDFEKILTNQPGATSWPITGATFILMRTTQENPTQAKIILQFFEWAFKNGSKMALQLDYIPMSTDLINLIENTWQQKIVDQDGNPIWK